MTFFGGPSQFYLNVVKIRALFYFSFVFTAYFIPLFWRNLCESVQVDPNQDTVSRSQRRPHILASAYNLSCKMSFCVRVMLLYLSMRMSACQNADDCYQHYCGCPPFLANHDPNRWDRLSILSSEFVWNLEWHVVQE